MGLTTFINGGRTEATSRKKKRNIYPGPFIDPIIFQELDKGIENGESQKQQGRGRGRFLSTIRGELSHVAQDLNGQMFASPKYSFLILEVT